MSPTVTAVENDCSFGQLKEELSEDERLDTTGTYLILDGITCSGTLVSWHSCFFYNTLTTISATAEVQEYRYFVGIFRRSNENFVSVSGSFTVLRNSVNAANMNATYGCDERNVTFLVLVSEGDLIGVRISRRCNNFGAYGCPGHPNLNSSSNGSEVFYSQELSPSFPAIDVLNFSNHVPVSINVKALILPGIGLTLLLHIQFGNRVQVDVKYQARVLPWSTEHNDCLFQAILIYSGTLAC